VLMQNILMHVQSFVMHVQNIFSLQPFFLRLQTFPNSSLTFLNRLQPFLNSSLTFFNRLQTIPNRSLTFLNSSLPFFNSSLTFLNSSLTFLNSLHQNIFILAEIAVIEASLLPHHNQFRPRYIQLRRTKFVEFTNTYSH